MKNRSPEGSVRFLVRLASVTLVGAVAMTATARLALARSGDRPDAKSGATMSTSIGTPDVEAEAPTLRAVMTAAGHVRVDPETVASLSLGDHVDVSPRAGMVAERFSVAAMGRDGLGGGWWRLDSSEFEESQAVLVELHGFVSMWMQSPRFGDEFEWMFEPIGRGRMIPTPKAADLPGCGGGIEPPIGPQARMAGVGGDDCAGCGASEADIAFFYTPVVLDLVEQGLINAGGNPDDAPEIIATRCAQETANTSTAMANTDLPYGTRLVHVSMVDFDEEGESYLGRFAGTDDGTMDEIHLIRDEVGADACSLVTSDDGGGGYCGVAYLGNGMSPGSAFSNLVWGCMGGLLFAHEFGHNLGCCHAMGDGGGCGEVTDCVLWEPLWAGCCMPDPSAGPDVPEASRNHGWRWVNELSVPACVCTVMAYGRTQGEASSTRVPYYSSPDVEYLGTPTGSPEDDPDGRWADNASVIRDTMPGTTQYRCESESAATEEGRLVAAGLGPADFFGISVATNGLVMASGASRHDVVAENAGGVYLFADPSEDSKGDPDLGWIQIGKIAPASLAESDRFGESVAMYEDLLVIGAPYTHRIVLDPDTEDVIEDHPLAGAASIWQADGAGGYCRLADLQPESLLDYDLFGASVTVAGDLVFIGAPTRDNADGSIENVGAVWVYRRVGDVFEEVTMLEGTEINGRFGTAVSASEQANGDIVAIIGAPRELVEYGRVYPYRFVDIGDDWEGVAGDDEFGVWMAGRFGTSVAIRGEDVIVGAPRANGERGAARVYRVSGADLVDEGPIENLNAEGDLSGTAVAITDTFLAIAVPGYDVTVEIEDIEVVLEDLGMVAVYNREPGDSDWSIRQVIRPLDLRPGDRLGFSVAIAGNRLFAGAPEADDVGPLSGAVYAVDISEIVDCNGNGIDDSVDIFVGTSVDHDGDGIPDECATGDCNADFNADGTVDGADLGMLFVAWGPCPPDGSPCPEDIDGDGMVGGSDLGLFCAAWGLECPGRPGL